MKIISSIIAFFFFIYVRERESRLTMLYEMKERYKKIYGMQAVVVLNLMHRGKDLLAFMKP